MAKCSMAIKMVFGILALPLITFQNESENMSSDTVIMIIVIVQIIIITSTIVMKMRHRN